MNSRLPPPAPIESVGDASAGEIQITLPRLVYENDYCRIHDDDVLFPSGARGTYVRTIWHAPFSVGVLPILEDGTFDLVRCYRHAARRWFIEIPKGFGDGHRTPMEVAREELLQELGLDAGELHEVSRMYSDPGMIANPIVCLTAYECRRTQEPEPERSEAVAPVRGITLPRALEMIRSGAITDAITVAMLLRVAADQIIAPSDGNS